MKKFIIISTYCANEIKWICSYQIVLESNIFSQKLFKVFDWNIVMFWKNFYQYVNAILSLGININEMILTFLMGNLFYENFYCGKSEKYVCHFLEMHDFIWCSSTALQKKWNAHFFCNSTSTWKYLIRTLPFYSSVCLIFTVILIITKKQSYFCLNVYDREPQ
jgi:hypothetical protein